ncbi:MAG: peptidylprolyl isomerase [Gemmatimonadota bacterium]|nr:peptidylprolyl isomerase [Gemmatimonadota bacterium]
MREPLVHFVALAALLFGVSALFGPGDDVIEITRDEIEWRILQVEAQEGQRLTDDERQLVLERYIDERVLVREAQALGLAEDERIDDILVQKMLHVLSGDVIQPSDEELRAYYAGNSERYAVEATVTVDEVVLPVGAPLPTELLDGAEPAELTGGGLVASRVMSRLSLDDLAQIFGDASASAVFGTEVGDWVDAYESVRGQHWFRVRERSEAIVPPLEVVREAARLDWIAEQEDRRLLARVAELRARYDVVVEGEEPGR